MDALEFRNTIPDVFSQYLNTEDHKNQYCIDCGEENPSWCSLGFAVLICLECAGKHRSLGVHITLVKSLVLDEWDMKHFKYLQVGGNLRFERYMSEVMSQMDEGQRSLIVTTKDKYSNPDILYYRELIEAEVEDRPARPKEDEFIVDYVMKAQIDSPMSSPTITRKTPKWIPNGESTKCMICEANFTILRRRHHCRRCGQIVCNDCAPPKNTRPIPEWNLREPVRHCKNCYKSPSVQW